MIVRVVWLCLFAWLAMPAIAQDAPVEGRDYASIDGGQPWQPLDGRIEVVEIFAYPCGHCATFQPMVDAWLHTIPDDVRFSYVPAAYNPDDAYARGFFAAQALDVADRFHAEAFAAIHHRYTLPPRSASVDEIATFFASLGVAFPQARKQMLDAATDAKMNAARDFAIRSGLQGTPTLIINGKYRIDGTGGRSLRDILRIADQLIVIERAATR